MTLTVIMKARGVNSDLTPGRDLEYGCLAGLISNDEGGILRTVLGNNWCLWPPLTSIDGDSGICVIPTYGWKHSQRFV